MKKTFLLLVTFCMACSMAMAGFLKVTNGDKKVFKNISGYALLDIDWSEATYDNRMSLKEKYGDFTPYAEASYNGFIQDFNKDCKTVKVIENADKANYKITIKVSKVDQYIKVTGLIPGPATKVWGILTVTDLKSGETLVTLQIKECDGGASPSPFESFSDSFEALGEEVAHLR